MISLPTAPVTPTTPTLSGVPAIIFGPFSAARRTGRERGAPLLLRRTWARPATPRQAQATVRATPLPLLAGASTGAAPAKPYAGRKPAYSAATVWDSTAFG